MRRLAALLALALPAAARGQAPYALYDPFYFDETARDVTDDVYALGLEASVQPGSAGGAGLAADPLVLAARLDVRVGPALRLGAVVDGSGDALGRSLRWSWVSARYVWTTEDGRRQALRLALDPATDGATGFPLIDLAFLNSSAQGPRVDTDVVLGARRVQRGYQRVVPLAGPNGAGADYDLVFEQALGWEAHASAGVARVLGPSGSRLGASLAVQRGAYTLRTFAVDSAATTRRLGSGAAWLQATATLDRPTLRLAPFVRLPLLYTRSPEATRPRPAVGLQLTFR